MANIFLRTCWTSEDSIAFSKCNGLFSNSVCRLERDVRNLDCDSHAVSES